jgi:hypothetical protein
MSDREDLLQAVRAVVVAVTGAAATKVIVSGDKGPRPAEPYLTVRVTSANAGSFGAAERINGLSGSAPTAKMRERREATISVQGFGTGAAVWLDTLALGIDSPASLQAQQTAGIVAMVAGGPTDISQLVDTREDTRSLLELRVRHLVTSTVAVQVELVTMELTGTGERYAGDPDPLTIDAVYP